MSLGKNPPTPIGEQVSLGSPDFSMFFNMDGTEWNWPVRSPNIDSDSKDRSMSPKNMGSIHSSPRPSSRHSLAVVPDATSEVGPQSFDLDKMNYEAQLMDFNQDDQRIPAFIENYPAAEQINNWNQFNIETPSAGPGNLSTNQTQYEYSEPNSYISQQPYYFGQSDMDSLFGKATNNAFADWNSEQVENRWQQQSSHSSSSYFNAPTPTAAQAPSKPRAVIEGHFAKENEWAASEDQGLDCDVKGDNRRKQYRAEKPKKDLEHSWLRTNATTQGKSTRTGKINDYDPNNDGKYRDTTHPTGRWTTATGQTFEYTRDGELRQLTFSVREMEGFLLGHPLAQDPVRPLTLWIQKTPADSGRRYPTVGSNKCRFEDCPAAIFTRSIGVGHFRVAIDEQWETHGAIKDPYHVAMYVHLYCLERFLDFPRLCRQLNVRCDNRELISEPKGKFLPALDFGQCSIAKTFLNSCRSSTFAAQYPRYPAHDIDSPRAEKEHAYTLTCSLTVAKNYGLNNAKINMMKNRGLTRSNILVHKGDVQMAVNARHAESQARRQDRQRNCRRFAEQLVNSDDEEEDEEGTVSEIGGVNKATNRAGKSSSSTVPASRPTSSRKSAIKARSRVQEISDDDEVSDEDPAYRPTAAKTSRKRTNPRPSQNGEDAEDNTRVKRRCAGAPEPSRNDLQDDNAQSTQLTPNTVATRKAAEQDIDPALMKQSSDTNLQQNTKPTEENAEEKNEFPTFF